MCLGSDDVNVHDIIVGFIPKILASCLFLTNYLMFFTNKVLGIATCYGLSGPLIESQWGRDFPHRPDRPCGPPILLYSGYCVIPGDKAAGEWRWPATPSSAEVKEGVKLYLYSHVWTFVACFWVNFTCLWIWKWHICLFGTPRSLRVRYASSFYSSVKNFNLADGFVLHIIASRIT
jgi:hypothetical protein